MDKEGPLTRSQANKLGVKLPCTALPPPKRKSRPKKKTQDTSTCTDVAEQYSGDDVINEEIKNEEIKIDPVCEDKEDICENYCLYCPHCTEKKIEVEKSSPVTEEVDNSSTVTEKVKNSSMVTEKSSASGLKRKCGDGEEGVGDVKRMKKSTLILKNNGTPEPLDASELKEVCTMM